MGYAVMKKYIALVMVFMLQVPALYADDDQELLFGVFPMMPLNKLYKVYSPMAADFSNKIGQHVIMRSSPSFESFETSLRREEFDIAFIQPFDFIEAYEQHGYLPLARRDVPLRSILIVRKDSPLRSIRDVKGKLIAAAAPSAAVTRLLHRELEENALDINKDVRWVFKHTHFACMQSVLVKEADACTTATRALKHWESVRLEERFRIIHTAEAIPHTLFVIHQRVPKLTRDIIKQTIINWPNNDVGKKILSRGKLRPFIEAVVDEYEVLRTFK